MSAGDGAAHAFVPDDAHPAIGAIHAHWESLRPAPSLLPGRRHFDPMRVPHLLPNVWLLDIVGDPPRFRYRLLGSALEIDGLIGATGRFMDEVSPDFPRNPTYGDYLAVARGEIRWRRGAPAFGFMSAWRTIERVIMPLAADGRTPDMTLNLTVVLEAAPRPRGI